MLDLVLLGAVLLAAVAKAPDINVSMKVPTQAGQKRLMKSALPVGSHPLVLWL